jgi:hypothetical protein
MRSATAPRTVRSAGADARDPRPLTVQPAQPPRACSLGGAIAVRSSVGGGGATGASLIGAGELSAGPGA